MLAPVPAVAVAHVPGAVLAVAVVPDRAAEVVVVIAHEDMIGHRGGEYRHLVDAGEVGRIEEVVARLEGARIGTDRELIRTLVEQLNELTTPFAERIMDTAIKAALEKKSVEELS